MLRIKHRSLNSEFSALSTTLQCYKQGLETQIIKSQINRIAGIFHESQSQEIESQILMRIAIAARIADYYL